MTKEDLRAVCIDNACAIRESQSDYDTPTFVEEVIEDADMMFNYIVSGKKPDKINSDKQKNKSNK